MRARGYFATFDPFCLANYSSAYSFSRLTSYLALLTSHFLLLTSHFHRVAKNSC